MFGMQCSFFLIVCLLGFLENVDQMFSLGMSLVTTNFLKCNRKLTVPTTFPDLLMIVIVSIRGIFTFELSKKEVEDQLQIYKVF